MIVATEPSALVRDAQETYRQYQMEALPAALRRNSLYYYYLSVYPGLREMRDLGLSEHPALPERVRSAYIHTPFCTGVCSFCSYFLTTVGDDRARVSEYLDVVKRELLLHQKKTSLDLAYLYFGGGTPSLIPIPALEDFFGFLNRHRMLARGRCDTMELHPEFFKNLDDARTFLGVLKSNDVKRVSVGFQSSDDDVLTHTNRRHDASFLIEAIHFLRSLGMMINLDLIYGLPGLSLAQWERTLRDAAGCDPDSISTYFLFVNPGTAMRAQVERNEIKLPSHETIQVQHLMAQRFLESKGYHELPGDFYGKASGAPSAFTQDTLPSDSASLPLGAGSYGYYDRTQFFNEFDLTRYSARVSRDEAPLWRGHRLDDDGLMRRDVMFSLKNSPHINRALFNRQHGADPVDRFEETFATLARLGLVTVDPSRVALTPKGRLCTEEICCLFRIPALSDDTRSLLKKKLDKHHFMSTYPELV